MSPISEEAESSRARGVEPQLRVAHFALGRTNPEAADGIDRTVYHLCRVQAALGHSVRLFSITDKPPIPIPGVEVSPYPPMQPSRLLATQRLRDLFAWRSPLNLPRPLVQALIAWGPDVVHLHGVHIPQHLRVARQARLAGIPYCVTVHGMLARPAEARHRWLKRIAAGFERPFLNRAAFLHALSESERADLEAYGTSARVIVVPNGIDGEELNGAGSTRTATIASVPLEFLYLGRLDAEQKGLDLLLRAFARLGDDEARLTIVGPDWRNGRRHLEQLSESLGLASRVTFAGPAFGARKRAMIADADIFVLTSRWEGVSFAVLEAAAMGRPCLLTRAADPGGRFEAEGVAVVVNPDVDGIARGLRHILSLDRERREEMGAAAGRLVAAEFGWTPASRRLVEAYRAARVNTGAHG